MMVARSKIPTRRKTSRRKKSSKKLQPANSIVVTKGKLKVANFETADHEIVQYFGALPRTSRPEKFVNAIRTGVSAFNAAQSTERMDYVDKKCGEMYTQFSDIMKQTIQGIQEKHEEAYGENGKFREIIDSNFGENGSKLTNLLDPNREGSPLNELKNEMVNRFFSMEKGFGIKQKEEEVIDKTPLKGPEFEDYCFDILSKAARITGDVLEDLTEHTGKLQGCKKGDYVLTLGDTNKKITFEVKDVKSISQPTILKTLDDAIENREASFGVLIVKNEASLPQSVSWWQEFGNNKLVCALGTSNDQTLHEELLLIATKVARSRVMMHNLKNKHIDAEFVESKIQSIVPKIEELRRLQTECANINRSSDKIKTTTVSIADAIDEDLSAVFRSLTTGEKL